MGLRPAQAGDMGAILKIIGEAKQKLAGEGIDQWQDGYPNLNVIRQDMESARAYVWDVSEHMGTDPILHGVIGYIMVSFEDDPDYADIREGKWLTEGTPYAVFHRLAVAGQYLGEGYAGQILRRACELAAENGMVSARVDTHEKNRSMRRTLQKNGFVPCGQVMIRGTQPRIAFERILA